MCIQEAACRLSSSDEVAEKIGAVNTLVRQGNGKRMAGHNTDWDAAISAVEAAMRDSSGDPQRPLEGKTAVVLGTGGAARALAFGAAERGASVVIAGRTVSKVQALAESVDRACSCSVQTCEIAHVKEGKLPAVDVVLNTTPLGMVGEMEDKTPLPQSALEQVRTSICATPCSHGDTVCTSIMQSVLDQFDRVQQV